MRELVARVYAIEQQLQRMVKVPASPAAGPPPDVATPSTSPGTPAGLTSPRTHKPIPETQPSSPWSSAPRMPDVTAAQAGAQTSAGLTTEVRQPSLAMPQETRPSTDIEGMIAGRWLNRVGILALILAVSFFLKYAFDNDWIGPTGRVAIGILLGALMLPWSQWLLGKGYSYFSEGIAALGQATLLASVWAGCRYYTLFSTEVGFAGMICVTAVMAALALGRNSERIALLSLSGGFLAPMLVSTGKDEEIVLFTYLLILGAGLLVIGWRRDWRSLAPLSFILTQLYFWGWYLTFYRPAKLGPTVLFATLFFLLYCALPVLRTVRFSSLDQVSQFLVPVNSLAYLGALFVMLWPQDRWPLTVAVLALSAGHVALARLIPPEKPGEWPVTQQLFAGLALTFVTLAIPIRLEGKWITLALALEGALLVRTGYRALMPLLRSAGFLLLIAAAVRVFLPLPAERFLLNERFGTYLAVVFSMAVALFAARAYAAARNEPQIITIGVLGVAINVYSLLALSLELWDYFGRSTSLGIDRGLAQHLALSLLWTAYASGLIIVGIRRQAPPVRWQALALFGLAAGKVFLYDSSYLERFYRILAFLILGLVLLLVSFLYQNKVSRQRASG
jgi:uncharacterized membrane protein